MFCELGSFDCLPISNWNMNFAAPAKLFKLHLFLFRCPWPRCGSLRVFWAAAARDEKVGLLQWPVAKRSVPSRGLRTSITQLNIVERQIINIAPARVRDLARRLLVGWPFNECLGFVDQTDRQRRRGDGEVAQKLKIHCFWSQTAAINGNYVGDDNFLLGPAGESAKCQ